LWRYLKGSGRITSEWLAVAKKTVSYENLPKPNKKKQLKKRLKRKKSNHQG